MAQLAMVLQSPTTQPKQRKAPKPLETPTDAPQARTGAAAGSMCSRCGQGPVRPGQQCVLVGGCEFQTIRKGFQIV